MTTTEINEILNRVLGGEIDAGFHFRFSSLAGDEL